MFNADQCDGLASSTTAATVPETAPAADAGPIDKANAILAGYEGRPAIEVAGTWAFYRPATDTVTMPGSARFASAEAYHATLFHELAHNAASRIMPCCWLRPLSSRAFSQVRAA